MNDKYRRTRGPQLGPAQRCEDGTKLLGYRRHDDARPSANLANRAYRLGKAEGEKGAIERLSDFIARLKLGEHLKNLHP